MDFTAVLKKAEIAISMDGKGAWRDNVFVERLWRSIKYEEVYLHAYKTVSEARVGIGRYLTFYNSRRPHSSLDRQRSGLLQRAGTNDGGGIIEAEIHLAKRPKLFRQTEPPLK
ncbi:transposase InsO family protein [Rhizobium sp. SLBN-94]|nr:transposase InsO family protein [Rhizobium sp. SLBN-94]